DCFFYAALQSHLPPSAPSSCSTGTPAILAARTATPYEARLPLMMRCRCFSLVPGCDVGDAEQALELDADLGHLAVDRPRLAPRPRGLEVEPRHNHPVAPHATAHADRLRAPELIARGHAPPPFTHSKCRSSRKSMGWPGRTSRWCRQSARAGSSWLSGISTM